MKFRILLALIFSIFCCTTATANVCTQGDTLSIFFGNGMFTDRLDAKLALLLLQNKLEGKISEEVSTQYFLSYNKNENIVSQLVEVGTPGGTLLTIHLLDVPAPAN